ncbi:SMP-30/gluconolactonase/LRE family protein [Paraburkholderia bannensis]|nr:SMP-30/gluconolactonase/LRE family protein [Paraburkholderia bannensis]RQM46502.1 SMP-30/gluconolactonase/LRE family protein [Paraburkholderia bannensis]
MNTLTPEVEWNVGALLGEGPVWVERERALYFVDIKRRRVHRYVPESGERSSWEAPAQTGFVLPHADGGFVCGLQGGLHRFTPENARFVLRVPVESGLPGNRLNDAHVDTEGRLWFGSMDDAEREPTGSLWRVEGDQAPRVHDSGYIITNGPAMSPDFRTLYHVDSLRRAIYTFDVGNDGELSSRRLFSTHAPPGDPDGLVVDAEGYVWVATFGGARIERYAPNGLSVGHVAFPCSNVTKLAFGGDDLRTAYVTTARKGLDEAALAREPFAGALFSFRAPAAGHKQSLCRIVWPD